MLLDFKKPSQIYSHHFCYEYKIFVIHAKLCKMVFFKHLHDTRIVCLLFTYGRALLAHTYDRRGSLPVNVAFFFVLFNNNNHNHYCCYLNDQRIIIQML